MDKAHLLNRRASTGWPESDQEAEEIGVSEIYNLYARGDIYFSSFFWVLEVLDDESVSM